MLAEYPIRSQGYNVVNHSFWLDSLLTQKCELIKSGHAVGADLAVNSLQGEILAVIFKEIFTNLDIQSFLKVLNISALICH